MSAALKVEMTPEEVKARNVRNGKRSKRKGPRNERKSMQRDIDAGATVVPARGSYGPFDYIALYYDFARLVQVKSNRWPDRAEMEALSTFRAPHYGRKIVERWDDYARAPLVREVA